MFPEVTSGPKPLVFPEVKSIMPQPLSFPEDKKPTEQPKVAPLTFPDKPIDYAAVEAAKRKAEHDSQVSKLKFDTVNVKAATKPLDFSHVPSVPTPPPVAAQPPRAMFDDKSHDPAVQAAVAYVQSHYPDIGAPAERITLQVRQLVPLTLDTLMSWGATPLTENGALATLCAKSVKAFTELNANEQIEAALKAAQYVPEAHSAISKMFSAKPVNLLYFKPRLIVLQGQLRSGTLPELEKLLDQTNETQQRLTLNVAALAAVCEATNASKDPTLERVAQERRTILTQAGNQAKLMNLQLNQTKALIVDHLSRLDQMINITMPAFEMANATK